MARRKAKKIKILKLALVAFFIYFIATFVIMQIDIADRKADIKLAKAELINQQYLNDEIQSILNSGDSNEYIMRIAREKLGFVFPNERVFIDINGSK